jgi:aromatic-L-amino-acid decarboxylase
VNGTDEILLNTLNEKLLDFVNASGEIFISHTRLDGRYALRLAIGNLHTTEDHVRRAFALICTARDSLA